MEQTYRHGEYVDRYERLVLQLRRLEELCPTVSEWVDRILTTIQVVLLIVGGVLWSESVQLNEAVCSALKRKKESLQKLFDRILTRNAEWKHLKLQLASAKESEANVQKKVAIVIGSTLICSFLQCDQFMLRINSLQDEVTMLNLHNEELLKTVDAFEKTQIESDCKVNGIPNYLFSTNSNKVGYFWFGW